MDAKRDWGHSRDYVNAMWLMLQQDKAQDYVIASHETHTVREFVDLSFKALGIDVKWSGEGVNEIGTDAATGKTIVKINPKFYRPAEVDLLLGNPEKAEKELGWKREVSFPMLVKGMVKNDLEIVKKSIASAK